MTDGQVVLLRRACRSSSCSCGTWILNGLIVDMSRIAHAEPPSVLKKNDIPWFAFLMCRFSSRFDRGTVLGWPHENDLVPGFPFTEPHHWRKSPEIDARGVAGEPELRRDRRCSRGKGQGHRPHSGRRPEVPSSRSPGQGG